MIGEFARMDGHENPVRPHPQVSQVYQSWLPESESTHRIRTSEKNRQTPKPNARDHSYGVYRRRILVVEQN